MSTQINSRVSGVSVRLLEERYRFADKFMALCRECGNYNSNWACPPFDFDVSEYLGKYDYAYVLGVQWVHDEETIAKADTREKALIYSKELYRKGMEEMLAFILQLEEKYPESSGVSAGGCSCCASCARPRNEPCRFPRRVRHSLESLSFDVSMIAQDFLGLELQWMKNTLPKAQAIINALFVKGQRGRLLDEISESLRFLPESISVCSSASCRILLACCRSRIL
jgi:predicted metal-binding protein